MKLVFDEKSGTYVGSDYATDPDVDRDFFRALFYPQESLNNIMYYISYLQLNEEIETEPLRPFGFCLYKGDLHYD